MCRNLFVSFAKVLHDLANFMDFCVVYLANFSQKLIQKIVEFLLVLAHKTTTTIHIYLRSIFNNFSPTF